MSPNQDDIQKLQSEKVLTIWWNRGYYPEQEEALKKVVAEWEQKTENKVELLFFSEDDILQAAIDALEVDKTPDILFSERAEFTLIPQWAREGKLVDVSDVIKPLKKTYDNTAFESTYLY